MVMKSSSLLEEGPWYFQWFVMNLWAMFPSLIQYIPFALLSYDQYILIFTIKKSFFCLFKWVFFLSLLLIVEILFFLWAETFASAGTSFPILLH